MHQGNSKLKAPSAVIFHSFSNVGKIIIYAEVIYLMLLYAL